MNKLRLNWWILPVLLVMFPVAAPAQYTFTTNNGTITITGYTGSNTIVTIPESTNGYPVTGIGDYAFFFQNALTSVTIPDSVTDIGDYAFAWCGGVTNGLSYINIPTNLASIRNGTFCNCTCLTNVVIPDSVTSIGDDAFAWCYRMNLASLGNYVTSIGSEAFDSCSSLASITIPSSVTNIGDGAFAWCDNLTNVMIGNSVAKIGDGAFEGCSLTGVTIPSSVASIGVSAFYGCSSLAAITVDSGNAFYSSVAGVLFNKSRTFLIEYPAGGGVSYAIPSSVTNIGDGAFADCANLTSVIIPNSVTSIGSNVFSGTGLASVAIPNSVINVGDEAFEWCSGLTNVTIGNSVASIGNRAFYGCGSLVAITVDAGNSAYCSGDGILFDKGVNNLIQCPEGKVGNLTIPDSITGIGGDALRFCASLTNVTIGNSVTNIALDAFSTCSLLASVTVGHNVSNIGCYAFYYCTSLLSVNFSGNAPNAGFLPFMGDNNVVIYYLPGTMGWTNTFAGRPAMIWGASCPWPAVDVGAVGISGSAICTNGVFTVNGDGADIYSTADAFRFVYLPVVGDCAIVARVTSVQNINAWSKAGVMIRESTNANATEAFVAVTPGNGVTWQYRSSTGGSTSYNNTNGLSAPFWVKLVRSGNTFTGYRSADGTNWTQQGTATIPMASSACIGLALTSHDGSSLCTATFENVTAPGWPPTAPPPAPGLAATAGNAQAALSWTAASTALNYNVKRAATNGGPYATVANVATTNYTDTGLTNGTTYYYVVSAINLAGEGTNSAQVSVTPQTAPTGLAAAPLSASQISLLWNPVPAATSYNVKRSTTNGGPFTTVAAAVPATNYLDGGLAGGTIYYYVVSAVIGGNETLNSPQAVAVTFPSTVGSLVHRYSFSETGGTTVADSMGGPIWTGTLPNGGTFSGGQLTLASSSSQYVSLPAGIVSTLSNFTIEVWTKLNSIGSGARLFDFGNGTSDYMFLAPLSATSGKLRFAISTNGSAVLPIDGTNVLIAGVTNHVVVTLNGATGILYVNGAAVGTNSAMTVNPLSMGSTTNNWLGRSEFSNPYLNGVLEELRIYNTALSPAEIAATSALGPGVTLSTNRPTISLTATNAGLTLNWPLASAGFTLQTSASLGTENWVNVSAPAPQIDGSNSWTITLAATNTTQFFRLIK